MKGFFFADWLRSIGRSRQTGWRWVRDGKIKVENLYGRNFVRSEEIERFFAGGLSAPEVPINFRKGLVAK